MIRRLVDWWDGRNRPKHNPQLARTAEAFTMHEMRKVKALTRRQRIWRGVRLGLLVVMLLTAAAVVWRTYSVLGPNDLGNRSTGELIRRAFKF